MATVRRSQGFARFVLSVQYHGSSFLGFSYQGAKAEDCVLPDGTDLRGLQSVEGRLRNALGALVGDENYENIQVSSRTDRGVHALKNTLHVDLRQRATAKQQHINKKKWDPNNIVNGLNFHLIRQQSIGKKRTRGQPQVHAFLNSQRHSPSHELRVLGAAEAPLFMENTKFFGENEHPALIDWNARFSATQRTYAYRILHQSFNNDENYGVPFEWDRSWLLRNSQPLDMNAMREAALYLTGTHDFSSFQASRCQRMSPFVTMRDIAIHSQEPLDPLGVANMGETLGLDSLSNSSSLVTIGITGDSFLYRQVRNMVGCLVAVGRGKLQAKDVQQILAERDRRVAPSMAPAHGLFLVDVQHGDFTI